MRHFRPAELQAYLQQTTTPPLLLDVREPWEFAICHIEGSKLVPMRQIPTATDQFDKESDIVVICHHGIRSRQIAKYLESLDFKNMINLEGGVQAWAADVDHTMATY